MSLSRVRNPVRPKGEAPDIFEKQPAADSPISTQQPNWKRDLAIIAGLLTITAAAFCGLAVCGFVNFDDPMYIMENPHVSGGVSWPNIKWAWTTFYGGNYLPFTWISLMLDVTLFGPGPRAFHLVNLGFHAINAVLVYLWFRGATGAVWRSALVAAVFAVHPLRVESVAWVVERKDVLTAFFALLAMLAYLRYVRTSSWGWYSAVLVLFAGALLAKQTLATFPCLLLLLDYWPLGRWAQAVPSLQDGGSTNNPSLIAGGGSTRIPRPRASARVYQGKMIARLIAEKLPLLLMSAAIGVITVKAQASTKTIMSLSVFPLVDRLANMPVSYARYLGKMVWFDHLAIFYPRYAWSALQIAGASALLVAITALVLAKLRSAPWLAVGWFWFVGMLVPMIGLVQFFDQSMADRFTYISGIGVLVMVVWSIPDSIGRRKPMLVGAMAATLIGVLCLYTFTQVGYWLNSITLFSHDIEVAGSSFMAETNLGSALGDAGDTNGAIEHLQKAVNLSPNGAEAHYNLANALVVANRIADARPQLETAVKLDPSDAKIRAFYAVYLNNVGDPKAAEREAAVAIKLNPHAADGYNDRGIALLREGKTQEAANEFRAALLLRSDLVDAKKGLEAVKALQHK